MNVRPLTKALQYKAERELNEVPYQIDENVKILRDWLSKQEHLKYNNDDQFLVNFLRTCKYSIQRTKEKLDAYYTFRTLAPEIATDLDPCAPLMHKILENKLATPLPMEKDNPTGPLVCMLRLKDYDPDELTAPLLIKSVLLHSEVLFIENDNYVVSGVILLVDLKYMHFKTAAQATPTIIKKAIYGLQKATPVRVKGIYVINMPTFFEPVINFIKKFLSRKITERVHVSSKSNLKGMINIDPSILPSEYGGQAESMDVLAAKWTKTVKSYRDMLLKQADYYSDESKRLGLPNTVESVFGIDGSFRKLEID